MNEMNEIVVRRVIVQKEPVQRTAGTIWLVVLLLSAAASISCLVVGLLISILAGLRIIVVSPLVAYTAVVLLTLSFGLLFLVGHSMDRIAAIERNHRADQRLETDLDD